MDGDFDLQFDFDLLGELPPIDEFLVNEIDDITLSKVCETFWIKTVFKNYVCKCDLSIFSIY